MRAACVTCLLIYLLLLIEIYNYTLTLHALYFSNVAVHFTTAFAYKYNYVMICIVCQIYIYIFFYKVNELFWWRAVINGAYPSS